MGRCVGGFNSPLTLSGVQSVAPFGEIVTYNWDFNADGIWDNTAAAPTVIHTNTTTYGGPVTLEVLDEYGNRGAVTRAVPVGLIHFTTPTYQVGEAGSNAVMTVTIDMPLTQGFAVNYATTNRTAQAGSDYTQRSGTVNFVPRERQNLYGGIECLNQRPIGIAVQHRHHDCG